MRLLRVGAKGAEKPAILHTDGTYRDLSSVVPDLAGAALSPEGLARIRAVDAATLPVLDRASRIGPCVGRVGKFSGQVTCDGKIKSSATFTAIIDPKPAPAP